MSVLSCISFSWNLSISSKFLNFLTYLIYVGSVMILPVSFLILGLSIYQFVNLLWHLNFFLCLFSLLFTFLSHWLLLLPIFSSFLLLWVFFAFFLVSWCRLLGNLYLSSFQILAFKSIHFSVSSALAVFHKF